ncbi:hypothetical protein [Embleya sp. NPDC020886]|uniref:hypothetical protein n=1 Tax=Embleya sp. NPDC020886 TaxID=3363980 RepID=UPI0037B3ED39
MFARIAGTPKQGGSTVLLNYEIVTDPIPLLARAGTPAVGTVYVIVSNASSNWVSWSFIDIEVPVGNGAGDLTPDRTKIVPGIEHDPFDFGETPTFKWDQGQGAFRAQFPGGVDMVDFRSLVLTLKNFPVSEAEGLARLKITEVASGGEGNQPKDRRGLVLGVLKKAPQIPINFRPERTLVDDGNKVVLRWDGPGSLAYTIQGPDGPPETVTRAPGTIDWQWSPKPGTGPKRDATYTLTAKPADPQQPAYVLTTTVHLLSPEFERVTANLGVHTPLVRGTKNEGQITFTKEGARIDNESNKPGTISAAKATVTHLVADQADVSTQLTAVKGNVTHLVSDQVDVSTQLTAVKGNVTHLVSDQVDVSTQLTAVKGNVTHLVSDQVDVSTQLTAAKANVTHVVSGRIDVTGQLSAGKVDLSELTAARANVREQLVAGEAVVNELIAGQARVNGKLTTHGPVSVYDQAGNPLLETTQDQPFGLVSHGRLDVRGELNAKSKLHVDGPDLQINGIAYLTSDLNVHGDVLFRKNLTVAGKTALTGGMTVEDLTVSGKLNARGNTLVNQNLAVSGNVNVRGEAVVQQDLAVSGNTTLRGDVGIRGHLTKGS